MHAKWEIDIILVILIFFFRKKMYDTSCRTQRAVPKNLGLGPQNRLLALWRLRKARKIRQKFFERSGHMTRPIS